MTSEKKTAQRAAQFASSGAAASCKKTTAIKTPLVAHIKTRTSNLPEEQQDKLLFEVFDMLLARNKRSTELSPAPIVLAKKIGKVKEKVVTAPGERTTHSKLCPSKPQF